MQVNLLEVGWEIVKYIAGILATVGLFVLKSYHEDSKVLKEEAQKNALLMQKMAMSLEEMTKEISRMNRHVDQLMDRQSAQDREIGMMKAELQYLKN